MTDCNTSSSNISGTPIAGTVTQVGSNLEIGPIIQIGHGFTSGSVIRFDVSTNGYTLAQANTPANAEVCGVVNQSIDLNIFNYVVHGEIDTTTFFTTGTIQGSTASEVFYLSSVTAGSVDSVAPQDSGTVLKTVLIRTPSILVGGVTQDRAIVKNYVGNYLGGDTALYMSGVNPVGSIHAFVGAVSSIPVGWALCDGRAINNTTYPLYEPVINKRYGYRDSVVFAGQINSSAVYTLSNNIYAKIISSRRDDLANTTTLVVEYEIHNKEDLEGTRGGDGSQASKETTNITLPRYDLNSNILFLDTNKVLLPGQGGGKTTSSVVFDSSLTPDLRNKFILGAISDTTSVSGLNQKGGYDKNNYNTIDRITASDVQQGFADNTDTGINSVSNMPPYVTINWIIRVGDASYTAFLNDLSLKTLSLTDIPSSDPGVAGSLYAGVDGILKVSG
jgi:microcystin-dependent protein